MRTHANPPLNLRTQRTRAWLFTLNNYTEEETESIEKLIQLSSVRYLIFGKEIAPTTGTPHLQGFLYLFDAKTFAQIQAIVNNARVSFKRMTYGHTSDMIAYCKKDGQYFEAGIPPEQGKRNDVHELMESIRSGAEQGDSFEDIIRTNPLPSFIRYSRGAREYYRIARGIDTPRTSKPEVWWIYGPGGSGKTRWATRRCRGADYWISSGSLRWFQGYCGQKHAILDDLRPEDVSASLLLRILDRYPVQVEIKGWSVNWKPDFIYITSCEAPEDFWAGYRYRQGDVSQLLRRIDTIIGLPGIE